MKRHRALAGHSASHERGFVGLRCGHEHRYVRGRQIGILRLLAEYPAASAAGHMYSGAWRGRVPCLLYNI